MRKEEGGGWGLIEGQSPPVAPNHRRGGGRGRSLPALRVPCEGCMQALASPARLDCTGGRGRVHSTRLERPQIPAPQPVGPGGGRDTARPPAGWTKPAPPAGPRRPCPRTQPQPPQALTAPPDTHTIVSRSVDRPGPRIPPSSRGQALIVAPDTHVVSGSIRVGALVFATFLQEHIPKGKRSPSLPEGRWCGFEGWGWLAAHVPPPLASQRPLPSLCPPPRHQPHQQPRTAAALLKVAERPEKLLVLRPVHGRVATRVGRAPHAAPGGVVAERECVRPLLVGALGGALVGSAGERRPVVAQLALGSKKEGRGIKRGLDGAGWRAPPSTPSHTQSAPTPLIPLPFPFLSPSSTCSGPGSAARPPSSRAHTRGSRRPRAAARPARGRGRAGPAT